jgi:hypothetical protein
MQPPLFRGTRKLASSAASLVLLAALLPTSAQAFCGFFAGKADASLFNEASQVVLARDGKRTVLSMLNDYNGPLSEFALVVPTPVVLKQGDVKIADKATFERLDAYSSPRLAEYHDNDPCKVQFNWDWIAQDPARAKRGFLLNERSATIGIRGTAANADDAPLASRWRRPIRSRNTTSSAFPPRSRMASKPGCAKTATKFPKAPAKLCARTSTRE